MESSDKKIDLIKKVNNIIYQQSVIKRDESDNDKLEDNNNIKGLEDLKNSDLGYLSPNDSEIFVITVNALINFYKNDKIHNPKLLSERFFENVRAQNIENEHDKDVRMDGSINSDLDDIINVETSGDTYTKNRDIESLIAKKTLTNYKDTISSKGSESVNSIKKVIGDAKEKAVKEAKYLKKNIPDNISVELSSSSGDKTATISLNKSETSSFDSVLEQVRLAHINSIKDISDTCSSNNNESHTEEIKELKKNREPLKCDSEEDTLKIKKEVVDDMGIFINKLFDEEMEKIENWEDKEQADKFKNFYQSYNLKLVDYLIEKYKMED